MTPPTSRPLARAYEHLTAGRVAEAAGAYRAALQIDASEPQAHAGLGHCAFLRGQHREAFDHFVRAAALWRERDDTIAALGCYTHAVASDPSQLDIHVEIAELEVELGNTEAARQRLEGLAENYLASGRADDAVAILEFVNGWDEPVAAPEVVPAPAGIPDFAPEPVRDVEGTMVISTFLLTPDGKPFVAAAAARAHAPAPEPEPEPDLDVDVDDVPSIRFNTAPAAEPASEPIEIDEEVEATATRPTPIGAVADEDALVSASDLDGIELPADLFGGEAVEDRDATTVRPIPVAAMPPRQQPAPPSRDAQGRTLAERLRTTRARAATAPNPTTKPTLAALASAAAARANARAGAAKPATPPPGKPTAVGKPPAAGRVATPQPNRPTPASPTASRPGATPTPATTPTPRASTPAARPTAATPRASTTAKPTTAKPAPAAPTRATPAPRAGKHATPAAKPPARAAAPTAAASKPTATARPTAPARSATTPKPEPARATPPAGRTEPRRGAEPNKRGAAVRTRGAAPGVPTAVGPSRTLPLVIPPPPKAEELDDSRTVLYRGNE